MGISIIMLQSRSILLEELTLKKPYFSRSSHNRWSRRQKLSELDYPTIQRPLQNPSSEMDQTNLRHQLHSKFAEACKRHQPEPFISDDDIIPFIQDITDSFPSHSFDLSIPPRQPFDLSYFTPYCYSPKMQIQTLPNFSKKAYPQGLFPKYNLGLWEPNTKIQDDVPDLQMCKDIWTSANQDPEITKQLIQKELADGFIGEIPDIKTAEKRWPQGIGLGKLGETHDWSSVPLSAV